MAAVDLPVLYSSSDPSRPKPLWKRILALLPAAGLLALLVWLLYLTFVRPRMLTRADIDEAMLLLLAQPEFAGADFEPQLIGDAALELVRLQERTAYFSVPCGKKSADELEASLRMFLSDPQDIVRCAARNAGGQELDGIYCPHSPEDTLFFRTPCSNFCVDPEKQLLFRYPSGAYAPTVREIARFSLEHEVYGGRHLAILSQWQSEQVVLVNHGRYVAKPQEPSLSRFVGCLLGDSPSASRESKVQRLLDFVTREIAYNGREAAREAETMRTACSVLMVGRTDCSNKAILFASLLEQLSEDCLLLYFDKHISVAVRQGAFPDENGLSFTYDGQSWSIAEPTASGWLIGESLLAARSAAALAPERIRYLQRPRDKDTILEARSGRALFMQ